MVDIVNLLFLIKNNIEISFRKNIEKNASLTRKISCQEMENCFLNKFNYFPKNMQYDHKNNVLKIYMHCLLHCNLAKRDKCLMQKIKNILLSNNFNIKEIEFCYLNTLVNK